MFFIFFSNKHRDGVELKPVNVDRTYDFNYQEIKHLDPYVKVKKGDSFRLRCNYSSVARSKFTQVLWRHNISCFLFLCDVITTCLLKEASFLRKCSVITLVVVLLWCNKYSSVARSNFTQVLWRHSISCLLFLCRCNNLHLLIT